MILNIKEEKNYLVITPGENLIGDKSSEFSKELESIKEECNKDYILFNLAKINQVDSFTLSTLVAFGYDVKSSNIKLLFCSLHPFIMSIFKMMKMNDLFTIYDNINDAIERIVEEK
ncbi:MAG: STAS domain-containing protein [Candidatus Delongbacteria bacterium]|nr:STAS domain-containing protein [Candidatus Delongbacteria bacterium]MBN2837067.1 STAS domain-containing protein [Candidatus Delongbacteria bacterium]